MIYLLNIGYALMLLGLAIRNILTLRLILIAAQSAFVFYGFFTKNYTVAGRNSVFVAVNAFQAIVLLRRRRPVTVPAGIQDIYDQAFYHMSKREFLYFWQMGREVVLHQGPVVKDGETQDELLLIVEGTVQVMKNQKEIATLTRGSFVAEMSFMTGKPASADVKNIEKLECRSWSRESISNMQRLNYELWNKVHHTLSSDLAEKVRQTSSKIS